MAYRKILHLDLDAFFCAVEELRQPELVGKAFAVGGAPNKRGVVSSCSYAARRMGVHSAMPMAKALKLCPNLIVVRGSHHEYGIYSERVMNILRNISPLVEQVSIDEAFIDVSDLPEDGETIARRLQEKIQTEVNLPCSLGVATNKLVAKIANNIGKSSHRGDTPPRAIKVVKPGEEAAFLAVLPVKEMWGVGPKSAENLTRLGINTIGDLANASEKFLTQHFGKMGGQLARSARGIDDRQVEVEYNVKSVSQEITFSKDVQDLHKLEKKVEDLAEQVGFRLRHKHLCAATIRIKLRWSDFSTITRQVRLPQPTNQDQIIIDAALKLLRANFTSGRSVRLIGVGTSGLCEPAYQLALFDQKGDKERKLLNTLDELRDRYGEKVIRKGSSIHSKTKNGRGN
jgi:DNA polymerase-4